MADILRRVVADGLCTGCGLCASEFGSSHVSMEMSADGYLRPHSLQSLTAKQADLFRSFCPGITLDLEKEAGEVHPLWGVIVTCATGWATDPEIRLRGSSGGVLSGLLVHLLDSGAADFVAHIVADTELPLRNRLRISRNRDDVLSGAGSRYAPSAPLAALDDVFAQPGRLAFVGKPCDIAALRAHLKRNPERRERVVALLSFMCAGIPSENGTHEVIRKLGAVPQDVVKFDYRGNGWPGKATAWTKDGRRLEMDYAASWGTILNRHLQFRCKICPDGIGEFADIVGADAWHGEDGYPDFEERAGRSLIIARTQRGEQLLEAAHHAGAIVSEACLPANIGAMQPYQVKRRQLVASRLAALWLWHGHAPTFIGLRLWRNAIDVGIKTQVRSFAGTMRRLSSGKRS